MLETRETWKPPRLRQLIGHLWVSLANIEMFIHASVVLDDIKPLDDFGSIGGELCPLPESLHDV